MKLDTIHSYKFGSADRFTIRKVVDTATHQRTNMTRQGKSVHNLHENRTDKSSFFFLSQSITEFSDGFDLSIFTIVFRPRIFPESRLIRFHAVWSHHSKNQSGASQAILGVSLNFFSWISHKNLLFLAPFCTISFLPFYCILFVTRKGISVLRSKSSVSDVFSREIFRYLACLTNDACAVYM